jgi:hypothetical protein
VLAEEIVKPGIEAVVMFRAVRRRVLVTYVVEKGKPLASPA